MAKKNTPGCTCCGGSCDQTFHVTGCNGYDLPGATVTLTGPGTTAITDASGNVVFSLAPGSYPYTVTRGRFTAASGTLVVPNPCTVATTTVAMTITSNVCTIWCAQPVSRFLNCTYNPGPIPFTMTYNTGTALWSGTVPGLGTITWDGSANSTYNVGVSWTMAMISHSCSPADSFMFFSSVHGNGYTATG